MLGEATWPMVARLALLALLGAQGQEVLSLSGRIVHHAAATYPGDGKTDAKDAKIIADQARMRSDLQPAPAPDEVTVSLRLQASHRLHAVQDQVKAITQLRAINRLRAILLGYSPRIGAVV